MIIVITWIAVAVVALVLYLNQSSKPTTDPVVNFIPNKIAFYDTVKLMMRWEHITESLMRHVHLFPNDKIVAIQQYGSVIYRVMDLEIFKRVAIKDFDYFVDRMGFVTEHDPLFGRGLLNLKGEEWREMRSTLSPAFTSSKIRLMVPFMVEVGEQMNKVLRNRIKDSGNGYIDVELKDITTRYANDVIATCAFGLKVESQSSDNQFYLKSKDMTSFDDMSKLFKILINTISPALSKLFKLYLTSAETSNFFIDVVLSTMANREKHNIIRNDMIHILNEVKKGSLSHEKADDTDAAGFATVEESAVGKKTHNRQWTDTELVAQAVLFLLAGFDTVSTTMTFILYELANNPNEQKRLVEEIKDYDAKNGGKFDFNSIQSMEYMDMVVSEGLRLHPAALMLDRKCIKDYNIGRANDSFTKDLIIRKGSLVQIPVWTTHRDPELFPNPDKFDPERFSEENKHNIKPFSYMPFGIGPRNCIGSRFALCEVKVMLYQLLREIEIVPAEKTVYPVKLAGGFVPNIKDGAWVRLKVREN